jgi:hypothetical protein
MEQEPLRRQDPLALAVFGAALALLAGLLLYVFFFKTPEPAKTGRPARAFDLVEALRRQVAGLAARFEEPPAPKRTPASAPAPKSPSKAAPAPASGAYQVWLPPAGMTWTYRVSIEPPAWQDAVLAYSTAQQGDVVIVNTDFRHAKGGMKFQLGVLLPGHASHANTRFPGFFLYPAYFGDKLSVGQSLAWEWPWQLPGGGVKAGRVKRYEGRVVASEQYRGPVFDMASMLRIEGALSYIDDGRVQASARETLWYAGKAAQLVRIEREGRTPDEGASRIVAELVEMR